MIAESKSEVVIFMYANAKIPEPFCRRAEKPPAGQEKSSTGYNKSPAGHETPSAVSAAETGTSTEQKQPSGSQSDPLPLLAFLLMEFFH